MRHESKSTRKKLAPASLEDSFKYRAEFAALNSIVVKMQDLKRLSLISDRDASLDEAKQLLRQSDSLAKPFALRAMRAGMNRLADRMDALIYAAQIKHDCQMEKSETASKTNSDPGPATAER